ncbi:hypothetical protein NPA31_010195 [Aurantimonas sp. MSK8Z-1]|uniref:hypothetical protein n=1 Tax=Mangrovibrevibacter kandeliae TaxID=2968473 RepID=UPI0021194176|nr:hypothetical protein [Aurantimonas sp. MSK8Z-1]MCW4115329.1 hypothetical protein [Aurantimonas sp. MSK8Z-1]
MKFAVIALAVGCAGTALAANIQGAAITPGEGLATVITDDTATGSVPATPARPVASEALRVIDMRSGASCKLAQDRALGPELKPVPMNPDCAATPELKAVVYWKKTEDGVLVMADAGGQPVIEFVPGDGVLYESQSPASALLTIVPARS